MRTKSFAGGLYAVIALALLACERDENSIHTRSEEAAIPAPSVIQSPGRYLIRGGADELYIFNAPANAVGYQLGGDQAIEQNSGGLISDRSQPWFFHSTPEGEVWAYDVALGVVRWSHEEGRGWQSVRLMDDSVELATAIPDVFFNRLPKPIQDHWAPVRNS